MASSDRTFGGHLKRFALSVDILDDGSFGRIGNLIQDYVSSELQIEYFEVMDRCVIDQQEGLKTMWSSESERDRSKTILDDDGHPRDQTALALTVDKPLWVVTEDHGPLDETSKYMDLWSGVEDLPVYTQPTDMEVRTSIIVPLARGRRRRGVIYLESTQYLEITEVAKEELQALADAVVLMILNRESTKTAKETTNDVIDELSAILANSDLPRLAKPQVFVATASGADPGVVESIMNALDGFSAKLTPMLWSDIRDAGPIDRQIVESITRCRFGVCYMSEPEEDPDYEWSYRDNPNVLFEAGMLHSLTSTEYTGGWIPIREEDSPQPPFDFAHERIELVPRMEGDGSIKKDAFETALAARIEHLLGPD